MKKVITICVVVTMILAVSGISQAVSIDMYAAGAPNVYGGSSYDPWWANAQTAVINGSTNNGSGTSEYIQLSATGGTSADQPGYQAVVSGFDSWHGVAGGTGEYGTRIHFIYDIQAGASESLALANISDIDVLEDGWGDTDYPIYENFYGSAVSFDATTTFDPKKRVGFKADGTAVTSGNDMTDIVRIIGNFGMAYAAYYPATYYGGASEQEELDLTIADINANLQNWTGILTYDGTTVDTTVTFVPEPATICILGLGGLLLRRKKIA